MEDNLKESLKSNIEFVENKRDFKSFFYQDSYWYFLELSENNDYSPKEREYYRLIGLCCHMMLSNHDFHEPLQPSIILSDKVSVHPDSISQNIGSVKDIIDSIDDGLIKSRLCEVLMQLDRKEGFKYIDNIILGYINRDLDSDLWISTQSVNYERALNLSRKYSKTYLANEIECRLLRYVDNNINNGKSFSLSVFKLINSLQVKLREEFNTIDSMEQYAVNLIGNNELDTAARTYASLMEYFRKDNFKRSEYAIRKAKTHVLEAENYLESDERMRHNFARDLFGKALVLLKNTTRDARGDDVLELMRILPQKIDETGKLSLNEMHLIEHNIDISDIVGMSLEHIRKSKTEGVIGALFRFSGFGYLKEDEIMKSLADTPVSIATLLGSSKTFSADGRLIHTSNGIREGSHDFSMAAKNYTDIHVHGQIIPCLNYIKEEYFITRELIYDLCEQSEIVPEHLTQTFISALLLGFNFKFHQAIYIICPLIEGIVRNKLKSLGIDTQYREVDQTSVELGLSKLMELAENNSAMPKDIIFTIKFIFCDQMGYNLRNDAAHGLLSDNQAQSTATIYAWWILFRLVIRATSTSKDI